MKLIEYILSISFFVSISLYASILLGPGLIRKGINGTEKYNDSIIINGLELDYLNGNVTTYLQLKLSLNNDSFKYIYRVEENKHRELEMFLYSNGYINKRNAENYKIGSEDLPLVLTPEELAKYSYATAKYNNKSIEYFALEEFVFIGNKDSLLKRGAMIIWGVVMVLLGCSLFTIGGLAVYNNYRTYKNTGKFPSLPNSIDEMKKGLVFLFFKKK